MELMEPLCENADFIIHTAAVVGDPASKLFPELTTEVNEKASIRLIETAQKTGVKGFVFFSTCSNLLVMWKLLLCTIPMIFSENESRTTPLVVDSVSTQQELRQRRPVLHIRADITPRLIYVPDEPLMRAIKISSYFVVFVFLYVLYLYIWSIVGKFF